MLVDLRFGETFSEDALLARLGAQAAYGVTNSQAWAAEVKKRRSERQRELRAEKERRRAEKG